MKQIFELTDYLGPLAASMCFFVAIFLLSLIINFIWISKDDERTIFEKFGSNLCGVRRMRHRSKKGTKMMNKLMVNSCGPAVDTTVE
ncbi:unnamed protein product [Brugia pahangi]|uniref:Col_cuticle_N domain-containing protein n=1 Tax=Brugia pahangi TaxID=6280 RepID=A0A0N4TXQ1_BRUPA|nr:unnamed protein product [Brugia pahangi]